MQNLVKNVAANARHLALADRSDPERAIARAIDFAFEQKQIDASQAIENRLRIEVSNELTGFGIVQPLLDDAEVEEIWVNSPTEIFVSKSGQNFFTGLKSTESEIRSIVERMLRPTGRRVDRSSPFVDATLPDGSRLHVAIPDVTKRHWSINIRKFPSKVLTLADLVAASVLNADQLQKLQTAMAAKKNILVSGATQAGKTTLLCALLETLDDTERLVTVEETFEIRTSHRDWVALQTRPDSIEGSGSIALRRLIKEALRMRPSMLVVGEVREAESLDLLIALNSGLPGLCTIHANSASEAISKLSTLPLLAGQNIPGEFIRRTVSQVVDLVVHCELTESGRRKISEVCEVQFNAETLEPRVVRL